MFINNLFFSYNKTQFIQTTKLVSYNFNAIPANAYLRKLKQKPTAMAITYHTKNLTVSINHPFLRTKLSISEDSGVKIYFTI